MPDYISNFIVQQQNGILFKINPDNGFEYDYFNYNPSFTKKAIPKKMMTFFFLNLTKRLNFRVLQETYSMGKLSGRSTFPLLMAELCFYLIITMFIVNQRFLVWLYLIIPGCCLCLNAYMYMNGQNFSELRRHTVNSAIRKRVTEFLSFENVYWFLKYKVLFEIDDDLNILMVETDQHLQVTEREYEMVKRLTRNISEEEMKKWKENLNLSEVAEIKLENQCKPVNDWAKNEFNVFFKYNKWEIKD